ncbi:MAG: DsbE family thiol:disulfide interchange protein [Paracoccaceae bacterium]
MIKISPMMAAPPLVFAALGLLFFVGLQRDNPNLLPSTREGGQAPTMVLGQLGDKPMFDDATLRQPGVKLVNYWASWCGPCRVEHPNIKALAEEGVPIYGINYKDDPEKALAFLEELEDPYLGVGTDRAGRTAIDWGVYGLPETFVVDGNGVIVLRYPGAVTSRVLETIIRPAMARAALAQAK